MKYAPDVAAGLLGLLFILFGLNFFFNFLPTPPGPPEGSPPAQFMGALVTSGFLAFVKVLEIAGGILAAIPKTRNLGLLLLGPVIVNILAYHIFLIKGAAIADPVVFLITALPLYLLWVGRKSFAGLLN